jgi:hypothetical protein
MAGEVTQMRQDIFPSLKCEFQALDAGLKSGLPMWLIVVLAWFAVKTSAV